MKMEIFEFGVYAKGEIIAGFNDLDRANAYAFRVSKKEHCDTDVINSFTGEVHKSYACYLHITYNDTEEILEKYYEVKEREW